MPSRNVLKPVTATRLTTSKLFGYVTILLLWLCYLAAPLRADPILIGTTQSPSPQSLHIEQQLRTAYNTLGFQVMFLSMPSERRLRQVSNNQLGADLFRICQLGDDDDTLVTVQAKLGDFYLQAFSLSEQRLMNWQQQSELIVVHVRGLKMAELTPFAVCHVLSQELSHLAEPLKHLLKAMQD